MAASSAYAATSERTVTETAADLVRVVAAPTVQAVTAAPAKVVKLAADGLPVDAIRKTGKFGVTQQPSYDSNFKTDPLLVPAWGTGSLPQSGAPDVVGAFRFICMPGQVLKDDPIVYPGQPGKSHLHQFFGNTGANAKSTYGSLRFSGDSTCNNKLNRSAYWIPAMLNGKGKVVRPDYVSIYYKRLPESSPTCQIEGKACIEMPRGLRFIFGYNMTTGKTDNHHYFNCDGPTAKGGHYPDIVTAAQNCPVGNRLGVIIEAPGCWNGKDLNPGDHRRHMAFAQYGNDGVHRCPATHPYIVPTFTLGAWYTVDEDLDRSGKWDQNTSTWSLASDTMPGMPTARPGTTMHADWIGAWDDKVLAMWTENCINKLLNCAGGDLGNGLQLKMRDDFSWNANPRLVDIPKS
ncbi:DUF1996 domain-containing protein [Sphingomonas sp. BK235]|uniref:DUF1996 domain-containing protein n=1 Tax=Sphingomonas sp. BK235 TaxID=2512131 RepID=UPI00140483A9|nr:DUF1996 domain-containing protein [Sphingomonas sp. BK235]